MIKTNFKILTTILIASILFASNALAIPGIPNAFYGTVTWNGQPAPDGTTVIAKINGVQVASGTTSQGKYGYPLGSFYVDDPNSDRSGKTINFFVNNVDTGQIAYFITGGVTELNLSASGGSQPSGSSGNSAGGGGSVASGTTGGTNQTTTQTQQGCQEKWVCGDWGTCQGGVQTRNCTDANACGTQNNQPFLSQPCSAAERKQAEQTKFVFLPTGFFLGLSATEWIIAIVAGIIIAVVIIFLAKRKSLKKK